MPNQPKTVAHTVRVDADLWAAARAEAARNGQTLSAVIRQALLNYLLPNPLHLTQELKDAADTLDRLMREQLTGKN